MPRIHRGRLGPGIVVRCSQEWCEGLGPGIVGGRADAKNRDRLRPRSAAGFSQEWG
jgi:hypothetical protein